MSLYLIVSLVYPKIESRQNQRKLFAFKPVLLRLKLCDAVETFRSARTGGYAGEEAGGTSYRRSSWANTYVAYAAPSDN